MYMFQISGNRRNPTSIERAGTRSKYGCKLPALASSVSIIWLIG
jgi:hypothetical protein